VLTSANALDGDAFVLAAGSYSPGLARGLGLKLAVRPAKGYSVTLPGPQPGPRLPVVDDTLHAGVVPLGKSLRIAGTAEFAGFDLTLKPARIETLLRLLRDIYPGMYARLDRNSVRSWAGLRPMSADGVPVIGATPIENLYLNTGHGHLGWSMAAGSGRALADLIARVPPEIDLQDYAMIRI
jgi:D-amino-acid dehydrogenase